MGASKTFVKGCSICLIVNRMLLKLKRFTLVKILVTGKKAYDLGYCETDFGSAND